MDKRLAVILVLAIFLRTVNLESLPYWHWDEGVNMNIAKNLIEGRPQWFALEYVFVPHPPLYLGLLGVMLEYFGNTLLSARMLSALLGVATTLIIYLIGRQLGGEKTGLLAGLLFAVYPAALYWGRMAFANNLLALLATLALYLTLRFHKSGNPINLYLAGFTAGLATITGYAGAAVIIGLLIIVFLHDKRKLAPVGLASVALPAAFALVMLYTRPDAFLHDLAFQQARFSRCDNMDAKIILLVVGYYALKNRLKKVLQISINVIVEHAPVFYMIAALWSVIPAAEESFMDSMGFYTVGVFGLLAIDDKRARNTVIAFATVTGLALLRLNRADHMLVLVYPFLTVGLAALMTCMHEKTFEYLKHFRKEKFAYPLVYYPVLVTIAYSLLMFGSGWNLTPENTIHDLEVAAYINSITAPGDTIITFSHLDHLTHTKNCILLQSAAYEGKSIAYYAGDYGAERYKMNCSIRNVRYAVLTNATIGWMRETPEFTETLKELETWDKTYDKGYVVLKKSRLDYPSAAEDKPRPKYQE